MRRILILLGVLSILLTAAHANAASRGPRCAIKNPDPPRLINAGVEAFLWGEAHNRCLDPVAEMGTYACLEEREYFGGPSRVVECHSNVDRPVLLVPHQTDVFLTAKCDYTTIPRYYHISAYAWAISLEAARFRSARMISGDWGIAKSSRSTKRFCHISARNAEWRDRPW